MEEDERKVEVNEREKERKDAEMGLSYCLLIIGHFPFLAAVSPVRRKRWQTKCLPSDDKMLRSYPSRMTMQKIRLEKKIALVDGDSGCNG